MSDFEWMRDAACLGIIDEMWDDSSPRPEALRICFRCPVMKDCARYGLSRPYASDAGVLGGMGLYDRQRIRAGKSTPGKAWDMRLKELVDADWDEALAEDFVRMMPQLALR